MGKPAARISDMHVCPMVTVLVPHVGGPVIGPGCPTVLIGGMPAATLASMCICVGPPDVIVLGSTGVFIGGLPAARMGDLTAHGGTIAAGLPTVLIGEINIEVFIATILMMVELQLFEELVEILLKVIPLLTDPDKQKIKEIIVPLLPPVHDDPFVPPPKKEKPPPVKPPVAVEKDSISCKLVDQDGNPVANEKCEITLPDGSIRNLVTDEKGEVRVNDFKPGVCKVSFPDIHGDEWI